VLLEVDPINDNYLFNTLEWDYEVCKRRLRIIEGRIHERWVFDEKPHGEVRIKHNQQGDFRIKLGRGRDANGIELPLVVEDDNTEVLADLAGVCPITIGGELTVYPDADPETNTVDGYVTRLLTTTMTWSELRDGAGTGSNDSWENIYLSRVRCSGYEDEFLQLHRSIFLFDTSSLGSGAQLDYSTFSVYGYDSRNDFAHEIYIRAYVSDPDSNDELVDADYGNLTTTTASLNAINASDLDTDG